MDMQQQVGLKWDAIFDKCFNDLKIKFPRSKEAQIAKKIDISTSTFNRIVNDKKVPNLKNLIKIVIGSGNEDILMEAVTALDNDLGQAFEKALSVSLSVDNKMLVSENLEGLLNDRDLFITYLMAGMSNGVTLEKLSEILGGITAKKTTKKLINKKAITLSNGSFLRADKNIIRSLDSMKRHFNTYSDFYHPEHVGLERNYGHSLFNGLNKKGLKRVQDIQKRMHQELQDVFYDDDYKGSYPAFSVAFCDTLTSCDSEQSGEVL
jgi:hypothetical protein